jgi:hypothetical protein
MTPTAMSGMINTTPFYLAGPSTLKAPSSANIPLLPATNKCSGYGLGASGTGGYRPSRAIESTANSQ